MLCSVVGTAFTVGYAVLFSFTDGAVDDVFWNLFAFSSVIFLLPYVVMMLAFGKLRRIDPDRARPYRVPGGATATRLVVWVPTVLLSLAALFFVWNPFDYSWSVTGSIVAGLVVTVAFQEWFCHRSPQWTRERAIERGEDPDTAVQFADAAERADTAG
jgi:amino acid transporter